jgi:signal transduction histidine kinase/ActR/RegA family two-component response regulator
MNLGNPAPHTNRPANDDLGSFALDRARGECRALGQARAAQALSLAIHEALLRFSEVEKLALEVCRLATASGLFRLAWIGTFEEGSGRLRCIARAGEDGGCIAETIGGGPAGECERSPAGRAFRIGCQAIVQDISRDSAFPARAAALSAGLRSCAVFPLHRGVRIAGVVALYSEQPGFFQGEEVRLLCTMVESASLAIERIERGGDHERSAAEHAAKLEAIERLHGTLPAALFRCLADEARTIEWISAGIRDLAVPALCGDLPVADGLSSIVHPEDRESVAAMLARVNAGPEPYDLTYRLLPGPDGVERWVWERGRRVAGTGSEPARFEGVLCDCTRKKHSDTQTLRTQRMDSLGTLAEGMAHDINNVLAPILMSLEMLREHCTSKEDASLLVALEQSTRQGADLARQINIFARGIEGRRIVVDAGDLLGGVARVARDTFPKTIHVHVDIAPGIGPLRGDPAQLHQVLLQLALNARDAMPAGGQLILQAYLAEIGSREAAANPELREGSYAVLEVHDTGWGIPPNSKERIFEPFFTTKAAGKGTGLGLATSFAIVRSHSGFITVKSEVGRGSIFSVFLPVDCKAVETPRGAALDPVPQGKGERILVVDDEETVCRAMARTLDLAGYRTAIARDGTEAVSLFTRQGQEFAAVVTDMIMPGLDGPALVRTLQKLKPDVRIVAVSGLTQDPRITRVQHYGVRHTLAKPCSREGLLRAVRGAIDAA